MWSFPNMMKYLNMKIPCVVEVPLALPLWLDKLLQDRDWVLFTDVFPVTNMLPSTWETLHKLYWMRKGNSACGIICFLWKGAVSCSQSEPFLAPFSHGRRIHLSTSDPFLSNSLEVTEFLKVISCLRLEFRKVHYAAFHHFGKFWNRLWSSVELELLLCCIQYL